MNFPSRVFGFSLASNRTEPVVAYARLMYHPTPPPQPSTTTPALQPPAVLLPSPQRALPASTILLPSAMPPPQPAASFALLVRPTQSMSAPPRPPSETESTTRDFVTSPTGIRIVEDEIEEIPEKSSCRRYLWQIVLGINLLLLLAAAIAIPFIILNAWPSTSTSSTTTLPSQCLSYTTDTDATRYYTYTGSTTLCDNPTPYGSASVWVRFSGPGTMLATSVIPSNQCGTTGTGYYTGSLPTIGTTATGTVCYNSGGNTCLDSNTISVTNCSSFYVYLLTATPNCNERYCTV